MRRPSPWLLVASAALAAVGCRGGDDAGSGPTTTTTTEDGDTSTATSPDPTATASPAPTATAEPSVTLATTTEATFEVVDVPESGVPGIDSADAFCAGWSRFGGSWQVIQVAATFAPDPAVVPEMEVAASPVVAAAYDAMFAAWPDELVDEEAVVADGFFGPLRRRAEVALDSLESAGATAADLEAIGDAWVSALAARDPSNPVVVPDLSDDHAAIVAVAADAFDDSLVGIGEDPSMLIVASTPLTDRYLATGCPDQGALLGGEVDGG